MIARMILYYRIIHSFVIIIVLYSILKFKFVYSLNLCSLLLDLEKKQNSGNWKTHNTFFGAFMSPAKTPEGQSFKTIIWAKSPKTVDAALIICNAYTPHTSVLCSTLLCRRHRTQEKSSPTFVYVSFTGRSLPTTVSLALALAENRKPAGLTNLFSFRSSRLVRV